LPLLTFVMTVFFMALEPLQNSISRHFERQADRYALERTAKPAAYRSAFVKLARLNKADPEPHPWEVFLFHSHPPIAERLALSQSVGAPVRH
jgi:STE24 endopeptidase